VVWEGGGGGVISPVDKPLLASIRARWDASGWDLESRWNLTKELWAMERTRLGLSDDWKLGWTNTKSYVGITYMWVGPAPFTLLSASLSQAKL
jgi:hypothetical protein